MPEHVPIAKTMKDYGRLVHNSRYVSAKLKEYAEQIEDKYLHSELLYLSEMLTRYYDEENNDLEVFENHKNEIQELKEIQDFKPDF